MLHPGKAVTSSSTDMQLATTCASGSFCSMSCRSSSIPAPECVYMIRDSAWKRQYLLPLPWLLRIPAFLTAAASRLYIFRTPRTAVRRTYGFLSCSASDTGDTWGHQSERSVDCWEMISSQLALMCGHLQCIRSGLLPSVSRDCVMPARELLDPDLCSPC